MFGIGLPELIIILVIVLVLFGAGRIPAVMRDLGKGVSSFKDGLSEGKKPAAKASAKKPVAKKKAPAKRKPAAKRRK